MSFTLVGTFEGQEIRHEVPQGIVVIGRGAEAELRLPVASVSRRHAKIQRDGDQVTVEDLGSRNGTRLNGRPVTGAQVVKAGDRIDVAGIVLLVEGLFPKSLTTYNESVNLMPQEEISWDEVRNQAPAEERPPVAAVPDPGRGGRVDDHPARAGATLRTDPRPGGHRARTRAQLHPADPGGPPDPVVVASRIKGPHKGGALALSRTLVARVLNQRTSILTTDPVNDPNLDGAMSMISQSIRTAVAAPLFDNEVVIGLLYADDTRAKRITRDELRAFTMLANGIAVALSHSRYHQLELDKQRQDAQLATASEILNRILPTDLPDVADWDLSATLEPCFEVGGDLYDLRTLPDGRLAVVVGDVTGKGLGAALLVSQVLSLTRFMIGEGWEPAPLMKRLNREIFLTTDFVRFATVFIGILDPATGRVECVNAGHNPPVVIRADGRTETCAIGSVPVGMMEDTEYKVCEVTLQPGDLLAMFSDGIPETVNTADEEYGDDRFARLVAQHHQDSLPAAAAAVLADLSEFRGDAEVGDDVTLVMLRRRP